MLFYNFEAPHWVHKVVTTLVFLGFPVACLMAWGFDITPEGVRPAPKSAAPGKANVPPSIAVLPFADMSAERDQQYLGDGITENIITGLSRFRDLSVIASHSTFAYKGKALKIQDVASELGVRFCARGQRPKIKRPGYDNGSADRW